MTYTLNIRTCTNSFRRSSIRTQIECINTRVNGVGQYFVGLPQQIILWFYTGSVKVPHTKNYNCFGFSEQGDRYNDDIKRTVLKRTVNIILLLV